jgi:hypothetical protein
MAHTRPKRTTPLTENGVPLRPPVQATYERSTKTWDVHNLTWQQLDWVCAHLQALQKQRRMHSLLRRTRIRVDNDVLMGVQDWHLGLFRPTAQEVASEIVSLCEQTSMTFGDDDEPAVE